MERKTFFKKSALSVSVCVSILTLLSIASISFAGQYFNPDLAGNDNFVNFRDFAVFAENWQKTGTGLTGDFDDSGKVDITDLAYLAFYWLKEIHFEYIPGQILVGFKPGVSQSTVEALAASLNCSVIEKLLDCNVYLWKVKGINNEQQVINQLRTNPDVLYAERNGLAYPAGQKIPNDPDFEVQWNLHQSSNADINAPEGWYEIDKKLGRIGDPNIIIAIIDTGVDYNHPDLSASMWTDSNGHHGYDFVNDDNYPMDDDGHGTHVAGIAAADTNNNTGIAGVNWGCSIMAVKVLPAIGGGAYNKIANGIRYAVRNGARVINMSFGGSVNSLTIENAINNAYDANVVLVAAAGNSADNLDVNGFYPACYNNVICVSATDSDDQYTNFTNYGSFVDVAAPGEDIYSTLPNNTYGFMSGTSMAAPHVSGLAALCLSICPCLKPNDLKQCIIDAADDLGAAGKDNYYGWGRISVSKTGLLIDFNDLLKIKNKLDGSYILCNDINAADSRFLDGGAGWTPLTFSGRLNGYGFAISNLYINRPTTDYVGFIGENTGTIESLGLENVLVIGNDRVGGFLGKNNCYSYEIAGCYSTGSVNGNNYVGGFIGENAFIRYCYSTCSVNGNDNVGGFSGATTFNNQVFSYCHSTGSVNGNNFVGGFCGVGINTGIQYCYSTGSVNGDNYVGGFFGASSGYTGNCYSTGSVNGNVYVGGFSGANYGCRIEYCYSIGSVNGNSYVGGFCGDPYGSHNVTSCYFLNTAGPDNGYGTPKTRSQLKQQATFVNWDFSTIWNIIENITYPFFEIPPTETIMLTSSSGTGGSVIVPGEGFFEYDYEDIATITAQADEGYEFINWTGTGVTAGKVVNPSAASTTILMDDSYTVQANFIQNPILTVSSGTGGSVIVPGEGNFEYDYGETVPITAQADEGYEFTNWTGTGVTAGKVANSSAASTTILMDGSYTVQANFIQNPILTTSSGTGGSVVVPGEGAFEYDYEDIATITAQADSGYSFVNWTGTGVTAGKVANPSVASTTIFMDGSYTVQANFELIPCTSPTPNPSQWSTTPHVDGAYYHHMIAVTAESDNEPVEYYFKCINNSEQDSGWISSPEYTAGPFGSPNYSVYRVCTRDSSGCVGDWSPKYDTDGYLVP